jgi:hypothetical protein
MKDAILSRLAGNKWLLHLSWDLLGLKVTPKEDGIDSWAELVFGCPVTILDSFPTPHSLCWRHSLKAKQPLSIRQWTYAALAASASLTLQTASFVYI